MRPMLGAGLALVMGWVPRTGSVSPPELQCTEA